MSVFAKFLLEPGLPIIKIEIFAQHRYKNIFPFEHLDACDRVRKVYLVRKELAAGFDFIQDIVGADGGRIKRLGDLLAVWERPLLLPFLRSPENILDAHAPREP